MPLIKISKAELRNIISSVNSKASDYDRDEMAIPSYLHSNILINWLVWQRHHKLLGLAGNLQGKTVLDFGCGVGILLPSLAKTSETVYGVDLFPEYAKALAASQNLDVQIDNHIDIAPNNSIDIIFAAEVLEHIEDLESILKQFSKKLKPGGKLLFSLPTENVLYKIGRFIAGFGDKGDYHERNASQVIEIISSQPEFKLADKTYIPLPIRPSLYVVGSFTNGINVQHKKTS